MLQLEAPLPPSLPTLSCPSHLIGGMQSRVGVCFECSYTTYGEVVGSENNFKTLSGDGGTPTLHHSCFSLRSATAKGRKDFKDLAPHFESHPVFPGDSPFHAILRPLWACPFTISWVLTPTPSPPSLTASALGVPSAYGLLQLSANSWLPFSIF